ncbi:unannotated protein [freshwater metagenome]|uniref:Unannotated protein n=1 Tax=freshwater metagenome TaxID=449393 RepID=A0A6J7CBZ1_9ZZZZ
MILGVDASDERGHRRERVQWVFAHHLTVAVVVQRAHPRVIHRSQNPSEYRPGEVLVVFQHDADTQLLRQRGDRAQVADRPLDHIGQRRSVLRVRAQRVRTALGRHVQHPGHVLGAGVGGVQLQTQAVVAGGSTHVAEMVRRCAAQIAKALAVGRHVHAGEPSPSHVGEEREHVVPGGGTVAQVIAQRVAVHVQRDRFHRRPHLLNSWISAASARWYSAASVGCDSANRCARHRQ